MFYLEEKKGNIDYRGYIKPKSRDSTAETNDDEEKGRDSNEAGVETGKHSAGTRRAVEKEDEAT